MSFSIKVSEYQKNITLNICDAELLGKTITQGDLNMNISGSYYGGRMVEENEAADLLKTSHIINMVGKKTTSLAIKLGIGSESGIKTISDIPFLIVFKM